MARKSTTYKDALEIVIWQFADKGLFSFCCYRCGEAFTVEDVRTKPSAPNAIQKEHLHEMGLDGKDKPDNCRFSHKSCHDIVTNGTKATKKNSSKYRIADTKKKERARLEEEALTPAQKLLRDAERKAAHLAKPKQKVKSRGFDRTYRKKFDGTVERREESQNEHQ
ncbi:MAG: hypothetical protein P1U50_00880 [Parvibaculaceae bacterium]|nr:hypothetical protein [Parvibaculaceae bacterium]